MQTNTIPVITVSGDHYHVGQQIGKKLKPQIETLVSSLKEDQPQNTTWKDMLYQSNLFLSHCRAVFPQYVEELQGIAEGAGVPFEEVFMLQCEELWESSVWHSSSIWTHRGCTDFAARGKATIDGSTLLAHTNDLSSSVENNLVILKIHVEGEPEFLGVSVGGIGFSAGFNAAGIALTGNQVDSNDLRPGVPRLMMVRAILASRRLGEAMNICLLPQRASNYNNVIADSSGEIYSMEGSATDCEPIYIVENILAHANHYVSPPMRRFELDRNAIGDSVIRYNRAMRLLRENYGQLSPQVFQNLLGDHANYPASICKHEGEAVTVFSIIINLNQLHAWIGRGRPCQTHFEEYTLEPTSPTK
jgi:isopenicillin-N N-acyltransferase-like protein